MKRIGVLIFCFVFVGFVPTIRASDTKSAPQVTAQKPPPQLTDAQKSEAEKFISDFKDDENFIAKFKSDEAQIIAAFQEYLKNVEAAYPGYTVDVNHLTPLGHSDPVLVEKPKTPEPAKTDSTKK